MSKMEKREGSIFHIDAFDENDRLHRYFIISDRAFTSCSKPSESRYTSGCHCDACRDDHADKERRRRAARARARSRREAQESTRWLPAS